MKRMMYRRIVLLLACTGLVGCATLPSTGPTASEMVKQAVHMELVTPALAAALRDRQKDMEQQRLNTTLAALSIEANPVGVRIYPGARLDVTLWTEQFGNGGIMAKTDLGVFTVTSDGALNLPYVAPTLVVGKGLEQIQQELRQRFAATRRYLSPQISVVVQDNARQQIIVGGAANRPTVINWREGGVSLGEALTLAGGNITAQQGQSGELNANHVIIMRDGIRHDLPAKWALEADVQLRPRDRILLEHQALVNVQCLGGGWSQNTAQAFDETPSLSKVVASGGGLSVQQAQGKAVYLLSADRTTIYSFPWDTVAGLQAAQMFPVANGDIVYVASAPIVRIQQVANILFSAAYPITATKSAL